MSETDQKFWYAKSETQSAKIMIEIQGRDRSVAGVGTVRNYEQSLKTLSDSLKEQKLCSLNQITPEIAVAYLESRALEVQQSQLNLDRQAIQCLLKNYNHKLSGNEKLPVIKSELKQVLESRAYSANQVKYVVYGQSDRNALSTEIAYACGLRAHELLTLDRIENRAADVRPAHDSKFTAREGVSYTVSGKGGLTREIHLPKNLSERLEERRLETPRDVSDRGIFYKQNYDIGGGNAFSASFTRASQSQLGWSHGAHGVRHSYAQERMYEIAKSTGFDHRECLQVVSQEMGHFRAQITEVYLR